MSESASKPPEGVVAEKAAPAKAHKNGAAHKDGTVAKTATKAAYAASAATKAKPVQTSKPKPAAQPKPKSAVKQKTVAAAPPEAPAVGRAEDALDAAGRKIGAFLGTLSLRLRKASALARESAEDIWAEAQSVRNGQTQ